MQPVKGNSQRAAGDGLVRHLEEQNAEQHAVF